MGHGHNYMAFPFYAMRLTAATVHRPSHLLCWDGNNYACSSRTYVQLVLVLLLTTVAVIVVAAAVAAVALNVLVAFVAAVVLLVVAGRQPVGLQEYSSSTG